MIVNDYSAELIVASRFAENGWNVYFPHRDQGFDFIVSKSIENTGELIRPVQVKEKYPMEGTGDKLNYGYVGKLTKIHPEMILAIPYFSVESKSDPVFIAYMPLSQIKECSRGFKCQPAKFQDGKPIKRKYFEKFFDNEGLSILVNSNWNNYEINYK